MTAKNAISVGSIANDPALPPNDVIECFEQKLLSSGRASLTSTLLWSWWNDADPGWAGKSIARTRLAGALKALAEHGSIELPAIDGRLWDGAVPPLPLRLGVPANRRAPSSLLDPASEPWAPALRWVGGWIRTARPRQHLRLAAVQINHWLLATTGRKPPRVAREERSLHIFDDEKQLARLADSALFDAERLRLDDLSCDAPLGGLRLARLAAHGPVLVLENKATFDSAWRALRATGTPGYAAIVFGGGDAASALVPEMAALEQLVGVRATRFDYAGDVDIAGIDAATAFARTGQTAGLRVQMANHLWNAVATAEPTGEDLTADSARAHPAATAAEVLGLPHSVVERLTAGLRVPQERIDRAALADTTWWAP